MRSDAAGPFKDGFHEYLIDGRKDAISANARRHQGRRAFSLRRARASVGQRPCLRLSRAPRCRRPLTDFDRIFDQRTAEADEFYADLQRDIEHARRQARAAPGFRRHDLEQAVLLFRHPAMDQGRSGPNPSSRRAAARPQPRMDAFEQRRHHLDAGQVGISLVRRLGPGVSHARTRADRFAVRQGATGAAHARVVHAPERANAGVRVGVRRCESAGACLGDLARLSDGPQAARRQGRSCLSRARVSQADAELHLVGEPQGRGGAQRISRRLPRVWTTSACSTAARSCRPAATSIKPTARAGWPCIP